MISLQIGMLCAWGARPGRVRNDLTKRGAWNMSQPFLACAGVRTPERAAATGAVRKKCPPEGHDRRQSCPRSPRSRRRPATRTSRKAPLRAVRLSSEEGRRLPQGWGDRSAAPPGRSAPAPEATANAWSQAPGRSPARRDVDRQGHPGPADGVAREIGDRMTSAGA
jgi:hypothetical protein